MKENILGKLSLNTYFGKRAKSVVLTPSKARKTLLAGRSAVAHAIDKVGSSSEEDNDEDDDDDEDLGSRATS